MYPFCNGNANLALISHSQLKQYYMTKMKDQSSLLILYKEGAVRVLDNAHGNVYAGVANGTTCTMHSLAWNDLEVEEDAHNAIRTSTPGRVIDLPKPPDHITVDIKPVKGIKWPQGFNLSPNSNLI
jgi:hypothetical protein